MLPRVFLSVLLLGSPLAHAASTPARPAVGTAQARTITATGTPARTVTVKAGDTVYRIARAHGLTPAQLRALNGLKDNTIHTGQVLRLGAAGKGPSASTPAAPAAAAKPKAKVAPQKSAAPSSAKTSPAKGPAATGSAARKSGTPKPATSATKAQKTAQGKPAQKAAAPAKPAATKAAPAKSAKKPATAKPAAKSAPQSAYTVQRGDSLGRVARRYGVSVGALQAANRLGGTVIHPGQRLSIPGRGASGAVVASEPKLPPGMELRVVYTYVRMGLGETPQSLAAKYRLSPDALRRLNGLDTVQAILPGTKLLVPARVPTPIPPASRRAAVSLSHPSPMNIPVQVVSVDLRHKDVLIAPVLPNQVAAFGLGASVGQLARRSNARALINGSYFHPQSYAPAGDIVMQGRMVTWGRIPMALAITPDNRATIRSTTTPLLKRPLDTTWAGMETVIATGPRILSGGQVVTQYSGVFQDPALFGKAARSAVGLSSNRDLMFVTTHAKLTTTQMGQVMARLGLRDALLLDGGSSAGLAWNGSAVLDSVRKVSYGIGVFTGYTGRRYAR